jgi:hypothetical protein
MSTIRIPLIRVIIDAMPGVSDTTSPMVHGPLPNSSFLTTRHCIVMFSLYQCNEFAFVGEVK